MSIPGVGFKTACDVLCEISLHLIESYVNTTASQFAQGGYSDGGYSEGGYSDPIGSLIYVASQKAMYAGAMIVVGWGLSTAEVATITEVNSDGTILTSTLANAHSPGETILAPTFPTQQPTDPFFTQAEMLGYLSRAQNEFLTDCPMYYTVAMQSLTYGQILQNTPPTCIELNRVAASQYYAPLVSLTRSGDVVLAQTVDPHGLKVGSTFYVQNPTAGFGGVFEATAVPSPTTLTYEQIAADGTSAGGAILYFSRLYETTQTELTMANRNWRNSYVNTPTAYFEDRSDLYTFGVNGKPTSNFPVELLMAVRDTTTLGLLDGFLIPDMIVHILKYRTLEQALLKDGVQQDPSRARYCGDRYKRGVTSVNRYLEGMGMLMEAANG